MKYAVACVVALQSGLVFLVAGISWTLEGWGVAVAAVTGGASAIAGTAAYGLCLACLPSSHGAKILRRHLLGEAAKVVVSVSLLLSALGAARDGETLSCITGFGTALLAYPLAMLLVKNGNTERH